MLTTLSVASTDRYGGLGPGLGLRGADWGGAEGFGGTKPIWGKAVWGEGFRDGGSIAGVGWGGGGGAAAASALSLARASRAGRRARRVASRRYWSLEKVVEWQVADCPRGYFCGSLYLLSLWYCQAWVSAVRRRRRVHSQ